MTTASANLLRRRDFYPGEGLEWEEHLPESDGKPKEYFLYDPHHAVMRPALRGFRLEDGEYMPIVGTRLRSKVLGLELRLEKNRLRLYDPAADEYLPTHAESEAARRRAERRVGRELRARQKIMAKLAIAEAKAAQEALARRVAEAKPLPLKPKPPRWQWKIHGCWKNWPNCGETAFHEKMAKRNLAFKCLAHHRTESSPFG